MPNGFGENHPGMISLLPLQNIGWSSGLMITRRSEVLQSELRHMTAGDFAPAAEGLPRRMFRTGRAQCSPVERMPATGGEEMPVTRRPPFTPASWELGRRSCRAQV